MKLARSKNAVRNMKTSVVNQFISLALPFISRTVFIRTLGAEYLGVNSLFGSVLSVLSLAELGFGSAIAFSMYKAIADDDDSTICALLLFFKKAYRYVGLVILIIGLVLIPFLPKLVHGAYPEDINPTIVYLVFLGNTVLSYFLFAYLNSLLNAFQRTDIYTKIGIVISVSMHGLQILSLLTIKNYYVYLAIMPFFTIVNNIITAVVAKKKFPKYKPFGKLEIAIKKDIGVKIKGLMISKVCGISRNAFDSIFISMFLGLTEIAIYNNYYYIMNSITGFLTIVSSAVLAGAGNSVASETQEKNHHDMMRMDFIYMLISGWCMVCLICLYQGFMEIWVGKELLLPFSSVILVCLYFYTLKMGDIRSIYVNAKGIWWENRFRAIAEAVTNIALNYLLGKWFGINGIISATLISLFVINFCFGAQIIYKHYFTEFSIKRFFAAHATYAIVTAGICVLTLLVCMLVPSTIIGFIAKIIICCVVPTVLYILIYRNTTMYKDAMPWLLDRIGIKRKGKMWKILNIN